VFANIERLKLAKMSYERSAQLSLRGIQLRNNDQKGGESEIPLELNEEEQEFLHSMTDESESSTDAIVTSEDATVVPDTNETNEETNVIPASEPADTDFEILPDDEVLPEVHPRVRPYFEALFLLYTSFRDIKTYKVNKIARQLVVLLDKPFVHSSTCTKAMAEEVHASRTRSQMLKLLFDLVFRFNERFDAEVIHHG
jgi:hypothetical protein